jgi:hypothetical protein
METTEKSFTAMCESQMHRAQMEFDRYHYRCDRGTRAFRRKGAAEETSPRCYFALLYSALVSLQKRQ